MPTGQVYPLAMSFDGQPVPTPPGTDPAQWASFVRWVVPVRGGCFFWMGKLFGAGYGRYKIPAQPDTLFGGATISRVTGAHRHAYSVFHGDPGGAHVLHECDEPLCAPVTADGVSAHLMLGDAGINAEDRERRGRGGRRRHAVRRHGADTRERHDRSVQLQAAIRASLALGIAADGLLPVIQEIYRAGDPNRDQLSLLPGLPQRRLNVVR